MHVEVINSDIRCLREERYNNLELYDNTYLKNVLHPHTSFLHSKMFECDPNHAGILSISSGLFNKIVQSYINGVGNVWVDFDFDNVEFIKHITANWIVWVELVSRPDAEDEYEIIPSDEIFYENDTPTRIFEFQIWDEKFSRYDYYMLKKHYYIGYNENNLYKLDGKNSTHATKLSLDTLDESSIIGQKMSNFLEREDTGMDKLSIHITEQIAMYDIVKSLIFAIERKIIASDNEAIMFIKEKLLLKGFGKMKDADIDSRVWFTNAVASAEYISKQNPYVLESWELIENQTKLVSSNTDIPLDDLGFEISSWLGAESQKARRTNYENRITGIRNLIKKSLEYFEEDIIITYAEIGYVDKMQELETIKLGLETGVMTLQDAIADYWDISAEEAELLLNGRDEVVETTQDNASEVPNTDWGNNS